MSPEERERMNQLCMLIQNERDPDKFGEFVRQLNELLEEKERRFAEDQKKDPLL